MMNIACSKCARSFTWECDISTTPCGHVFHTDCIEWSNETTDCYHCQKACEIGQIIKLSFTESISAIEEQISINDLERKSIELDEERIEMDKKRRMFDTLLSEKSTELIQANIEITKLKQEILLMRLDWSKTKRKDLEKNLVVD